MNIELNLAEATGPESRQPQGPVHMVIQASQHSNFKNIQKITMLELLADFFASARLNLKFDSNFDRILCHFSNLCTILDFLKPTVYMVCI